MKKFLFLFLVPIFIYANQESNIYRIGSASVSVGGGNYVDGTLFGYKKHYSDGTTTFAADINYIIVEDNTYGVDNTAEAMLHLGIMATDDLELYGSLGYAKEGSDNGYGWGLGSVWSFGNGLSLTYEYRSFEMDNYTLQSSSLGILISF